MFLLLFLLYSLLWLFKMWPNCHAPFSIGGKDMLILALVLFGIMPLLHISANNECTVHSTSCYDAAHTHEWHYVISLESFKQMARYCDKTLFNWIQKKSSLGKWCALHSQVWVWFYPSLARRTCNYVNYSHWAFQFFVHIYKSPPPSHHSWCLFPTLSFK